ncbi:hypothetical protein C8R46DRAFT_226127 [Mycena filopes]|nr:hypothetical protein C8R46DRAFT_226127 [Mycena filopes]
MDFLTAVVLFAVLLFIIAASSGSNDSSAGQNGGQHESYPPSSSRPVVYNQSYGTLSTAGQLPRPPEYRPLPSRPVGLPSSDVRILTVPAPQPLVAPQPFVPPTPPRGYRPPLSAVSAPNLPLRSSDVTTPPPPPPRRQTWAADGLPLSSVRIRLRLLPKSSLYSGCAARAGSRGR